MDTRFCFVLSVLLFVIVSAERRRFCTNLTGEEEVPEVVTDTYGHFKIVFNRNYTSADFHLSVKNGRLVTQAHLHCAPEGVNGPIIVFLFPLLPEGMNVNGDFVSGTLHSNSVRTLDPPSACGNTLPALVASIRAGNVYVNVHTVQHPSGEIRGQL
eukprot:TRINITY_DN4652_c0_g1_i1.p1 TRINITY_DN4652_c0_g1~~TRINITY_DN4652_c0_g1_i1.p1  ORF type:complete len:156 (-),score=22.72 TRINITY_DN4652_c0_g1_i1:127-594(-)